MKNEEYPPGIYFLADLGRDKFSALLDNRNIFVAGNGLVTYSENQTTYGNNIKMAMDTLCDVTNDHFTIENLNIFQSYIRKIGLKPKDGENEFEIEAHFSQVQQLYNDPNLMNYWKKRCTLAESYIREFPIHLINKNNVIYLFSYYKHI